MKRFISVCLLICIAITLLPIEVFAVDSSGWVSENGSWKYYENGAALCGVRWIEAEQNRYVFDEHGILQTGDADGDVLFNNNLYYINPEKELSNPKTCYAVRNYTRNRGEDVGITYYDNDGITFVGWINAGEGKRMYQTCIPQNGKDLYIYVWRAQDLPECPDPNYPNDPSRNIPAGRYLFDDNGIHVAQDGQYPCNDGLTYTIYNGQIHAPGNTCSKNAALDVQIINFASISDILNSFFEYTWKFQEYVHVIHEKDLDSGKPVRDFADFETYFSDFFYWKDAIFNFNGLVASDAPGISDSYVKTVWRMIQNLVEYRAEVLDKIYYQNSADAIQSIREAGEYELQKTKELNAILEILKRIQIAQGYN